MGNNHYVLRQLKGGNRRQLESFVAWLLTAARGYAVKLVNPGGVEEWKQTAHNITDLDEPVDYFEVTPRQIIEGLAQVAQALGLPHPVHIHCNNLGIPGNWKTTLETMKTLDGLRAHLTHIQFHSYGGDPNDPVSFASAVPQLVSYVNEHPNLTIDVGQVLFGETTSMTGDGPLGYYLHRLTGRKWFSGDVEMEAGCGIVPIRYRVRSLIHAVQWAAGLEWFLLSEDPWRVVLSTDHPNGASFMAYPQVIKYLMSENARAETLKRLPPGLRKRTVLSDLKREYSLYEIAVITRAAPARIAGLAHKGHLGPGADGDVVIYQPMEDIERMFSFPRWVLKGGQIVVEDGEIRACPEGMVYCVDVPYDRSAEEDIRSWFEAHYTIQFANYPVSEEYLGGRACMVPARLARAE
jgi:formylmethanofuran dehydrogenase subunit A